MSAVLRLGRARTTRVVDLIGNDVAANHKKRKERTEAGTNDDEAKVNYSFARSA